MISVVILTKNEEKNIGRCLKTLLWCDEIIVIDDYSSDNTIKIAKNFGAEVYKKHLRGDFSAQRNFGLRKTKGDWVLFIDADERVSSKLKNEILLVTQNQAIAENYVGFRVKRRDKFLGSWLKYGETASVKLLRLGKRNVGQWKGKVHEVWQIKGKIKTLKNPLFHKRNITISGFLERIDKYSSIRAKELYAQGVKSNVFVILAFPLGKFCQNYFLRLGFLDGIPGFVMAIMMSIHSFLVRAKLYLLWRDKTTK